MIMVEPVWIVARVLARPSKLGGWFPPQIIHLGRNHKLGLCIILLFSLVFFPYTFPVKFLFQNVSVVMNFYKRILKM